jgi:hypothetical protein
LIYFTFRDDIDVVSSIFTCLIIIGGFAARVRILLEKGLSRHHILEDQEIPEKYQKIIFSQKTEEARRRRREDPRAGTHRGGAGPPLAALAYCVATLAHFCHRRFTYFIVPENLSQGGGSEIDTTASAGRKTPGREKLSGRQKSAGEIPSWRGEIIAIVIIITPDVIGIIITIILITSTFISTITMPSRCNILG